MVPRAQFWGRKNLRDAVERTEKGRKQKKRRKTPLQLRLRAWGFRPQHTHRRNRIVKPRVPALRVVYWLAAASQSIPIAARGEPKGRGKWGTKVAGGYRVETRGWDLAPPSLLRSSPVFLFLPLLCPSRYFFRFTLTLTLYQSVVLIDRLATLPPVCHGQLLWGAPREISPSTPFLRSSPFLFLFWGIWAVVPSSLPYFIWFSHHLLFWVAFFFAYFYRFSFLRLVGLVVWKIEVEEVGRIRSFIRVWLRCRCFWCSLCLKAWLEGWIITSRSLIFFIYLNWIVCLN